MKNVQLSKLWDSLHSSYWFLPMLMALGAMILALSMLSFDRLGIKEIEQLSWIYTGGPEGARSLLSAIAGSMITVAATAFSITIVALQLASSHFGPRLLRNFMQDTGNQIVLGTFIATFIYCLLILRTIRGEDYNFFVPQLSVTVGLILAIASTGVLIYFIHHASTIIQASHVISGVSNEFEQAIERLFPTKLGQIPPTRQQPLQDLPHDFDRISCPIQATQTGYLQAIDAEKLMKLACQYNLIFRLQIHPGKFVIEGNDLVLVYPGERISPYLAKQINKVFILGEERTEQQDIEFPVNQLVEIALRAISPAVNDPFTAIRCIDRLNAGLCNLAQRDFPSPYRYDESQNLRVIVESVTFEQLVDAAFNQLRQYAQSDAAVTIRLLEAIANIANRTQRYHDRLALQRQAEMILQGSREGLFQKQDQKDVEKRYLLLMKALI